MRKILLAVLFIIATASFAFAATIYLRDGRTVRGTLLGFINGRFVVRVEPRYSTTPGGTTNPEVARNRRDFGDIQYFGPDEIDRIEIEGRSLDEARYQTRNVQVALDANWVDSGVFVRRGERVQVSASGVIMVGRTRISPDGWQSTFTASGTVVAGQRAGSVGPEGKTSSGFGQIIGTRPVPNAGVGALIGYIRTADGQMSQAFFVGSQLTFSVPADGRLYLAINDDDYRDNSGSFTV